jgi:hypothetical protein
MKSTLTDQATAGDAGGQQTRDLVRTYRVARPARPATGNADIFVVQVRVHHDSHRDQSHATAYVMNANREWTVLAEDHPDHWHDGTPSPYERDHGAADVLGSVSDGLLARAETIIDAGVPA